MLIDDTSVSQTVGSEVIKRVHSYSTTSQSKPAWGQENQSYQFSKKTKNIPVFEGAFNKDNSAEYFTVLLASTHRHVGHSGVHFERKYTIAYIVTSASSPLHVPPLGPPQSHDALPCQHVQGDRVYALWGVGVM